MATSHSFLNDSFPFRVALVLVPTLVLFWQDIVIVGTGALVDESQSYVLLIPFLIAAIVYLRRRYIGALLSLGSVKSRYIDVVSGTSLLFLSLLIYLYGSYTIDNLDYHLASLQLFVAALILLVFDHRVLRALVFPIILIAAAMPYVVGLGLETWAYLSWLSGLSSYYLLGFFHVPVSIAITAGVPSILLSLPDGSSIPFVIGVASSGAYSVIGYSLFAVVFAYIANGKVWKRIALVVSSYPLLIVMNIVRISGVIALASDFGNTASNLFHFTGGVVLTALLTLILLVVAEKLLHLDILGGRSTRKACPVCGSPINMGRSFCSDCGRYLRRSRFPFYLPDFAPILAIAIVVIIFLAAVPPVISQTTSVAGIDPRTATGQQALSFLPQIPGWSLAFGYRDNATEAVLDQDATLVYTYTPLTGPGANTTGISVLVQVSTWVHTWEASLVTYPSLIGQPTARILEQDNLVISDNPPASGRFLAFQEPGSDLTEVVLYWVSTKTFDIGSTPQDRYLMISLWSYSSDLAADGLIANQNDTTGVKQLYLPLEADIVRYWEPLQTATLVQLGVRDYLAPLAIIVVSPAAVAVGWGSVGRRKEMASGRRNAQRVTQDEDKELLRIISDSGAKGATIDEITRSLSLGRVEAPIKDPIASLTYAERLGLVKRRVVNLGGDPVLTWSLAESTITRKTGDKWNP